MSAKNIRAGGAFWEITVRDKLAQGFRRAMARVRAFAAGVKVIGSAIAGIGAAFVGIGAAITVPMFLAAKSFADAGSALHDLSLQTGLSVESLSELKFAAEQSGGSLEDVAIAIKNMQRQGFDASKFDEIAASIAAIEDPTMRSQAALKIFGKSGTKLLPMLRELQALRASARASGLIISTEDAARADALGDSIDRLKAVFKSLVVQVGSKFADDFTFAADVASGALIGIARLLDGIKEGINRASQEFIQMNDIATGMAAGVLDALKGGEILMAWKIIVTTMRIVWVEMAREIELTFINMVKAVIQTTQKAIMWLGSALNNIQAVIMQMTGGKANIDLGGRALNALTEQLGDAMTGGLNVTGNEVQSEAMKEMEKAFLELAKLRLEARNIAEQTKKGQLASVASVPITRPEKNAASTGTFSSAAAGMLGRAGSPVERELKKTNTLLEQNHKDNQEIAAAIKDGGLAFA